MFFKYYTNMGNDSIYFIQRVKHGLQGHNIWVQVQSLTLISQLCDTRLNY